MKVVNNSVRVCVCVFDAADLQGSSTAHKGGKDESKVRAFLYFYFKLSWISKLVVIVLNFVGRVWF